MPSVTQELLDSVAAAVAQLHDGEPGPTSPALDSALNQPFAIAFANTKGELLGAGDTEHAFAIQSTSKALVYGMALEEHGHETVERYVDHEPSGESYDAISVEPATGRPDNPMINAGAITVHGLIGGAKLDAADRVKRILATFSAMADRELTIDTEVYEAEAAAADRNLAIAHMIRALGILPDDPRDVVEGYLRQCCVSVTVEDLAMIGATLANHGVNPRSGERVFSPATTRQMLSVMLTCGMYDAAGDWVSEVGIPAKSGVGGGILGVVPGAGGVATFAPKLDEHGTSVRGQAAFEQLSDEAGLHFVEVMTRARR